MDNDIWVCAGCGQTYNGDRDADMIIRHVAQCMYVDSAGQAVPLTVKWSATHWYVTTVTSAELRQLLGTPLPPMDHLTGAIDDDSEEFSPLAEYLTEQAGEPNRAPYVDGIDISDIYPASRDH